MPIGVQSMRNACAHTGSTSPIISYHQTQISQQSTFMRTQPIPFAFPQFLLCLARASRFRKVRSRCPLFLATRISNQNYFVRIDHNKNSTERNESNHFTASIEIRPSVGKAQKNDLIAFRNVSIISN